MKFEQKNGLIDNRTQADSGTAYATVVPQDRTALGANRYDKMY